MPIITPAVKLISQPFVVSSRYRIYTQIMDSSEKKTCFRNIQLPGGFASCPGAREVSSISGILPDDPGGITCMPSVHLSVHLSVNILVPSSTQ